MITVIWGCIEARMDLEGTSQKQIREGISRSCCYDANWDEDDANEELTDWFGVYVKGYSFSFNNSLFNIFLLINYFFYCYEMSYGYGNGIKAEGYWVADPIIVSFIYGS